MLLDENQARARLESPNNLANRFGSTRHIPVKRPGNSRGARLSLEERTEIAIDCLTPGCSQETVAQAHGVSVPEVSLISQGKVPVDEDKLQEARDKALDRLMTALGFITNDKLSACKATDLSLIAANMSRVVEKTMPKSGDGTQVNLIVYSPELRQEKSFKVVEI